MLRGDYMCNLSQGIREEGIAEGIEKGVVKGTSDTTLYYVNQLIHRSGISVAEAMKLLDVDEKIRPVIVMKIQ